MTAETTPRYDEVFAHVEKLPLVALFTTGRTGSDFFQSLLDGHSQILQIPGLLNVHSFWSRSPCKNDPAGLEDLIHEYVWYTGPFDGHLWQFKSRYKKMERWDQLGPNMDESFEVDIELFKRHCLAILAGRPLTSRNFLLAVHAAYGLASGQDVLQKRVLFYHLHVIENAAPLVADFPYLDAIVTVRDTRNTLASGMEHWKRYDPASFAPPFYNYLVRRVVQESEPLLPLIRSVTVLKLEDLHLRTDAVFKDFCGRFGLEVEPTMYRSTYHAKLWWADRVSERPMNGFNPNIRKRNWEGRLSWADALVLEYLLEPRLRHYGYEVGSKLPSSFRGVLAFFLLGFPTRYELRILATQWAAQRRVRDRIKALFSSLGHYMQRIRFFAAVFGRRLSSRIHLPDFLSRPEAGGR